MHRRTTCISLYEQGRIQCFDFSSMSESSGNEDEVVELSSDGNDGSATDEHSIADQMEMHLESKNAAVSYHNTLRDNFPCNPGLFLHEYGWLSLPLCAQELHDFSDRGKKSWKSEIDSTGVLQNPSSQFSCRNPAWSNRVQSYMVKTLTQLNIEGECALEAERLVLMKPGADRDLLPVECSSNSKIATIAITLPSACGECCIVRKTDSERSDHVIGEEAMFSSSALLWLMVWTSPCGVRLGFLVQWSTMWFGEYFAKA